MGHVVATRLDAYRMPLIRYALGDLAARRPAADRCPCGRHLPLLDRVVGRDTDVIRTPGGRFLIVHFFTGIFEFVPEIRQFQVVHNEPGGITIRYIPDCGFTPEVLERVRCRIAMELDSEPFAVHFERVEVIAPSPSGKPQIVLSRLDPADRSVASR
jgi:phenylacetate-CoA ligase